MTIEENVRAVYEGLYRLAGEMGSSAHTLSIEWQLQNMLVNPGIVDMKKTERVSIVASGVAKEYYPKFRDLAIEQRKLEAPVQR